jgi:hypothetical protein
VEGFSDARRLQFAAKKSLEPVEALCGPRRRGRQDCRRGRGYGSKEGCGLDGQDGVSAGPLQAKEGFVGTGLHAPFVNMGGWNEVARKS